MKLGIILGVFLLVTAETVTGGTPGGLIVAPSNGEEILGTVKPVSCGGKSTLVSLDIGGCNGGLPLCYTFEKSTKMFVITFVPESAVTTVAVTAQAKSLTTGETREVALRSEERVLEGNRSATVTAFLKFPGNSVEFEEYEVEFNVHSNNGREVCGTYGFVGVKWDKPYIGNAINETCDAIGQPCNFADSICSADMKCACAAEFYAEEGVCKKGLSWSCGSVKSCGDWAECNYVIGGRVCQCSAGWFVAGNRCVRNEQTNLGDTCEYIWKPCDFPRSECSSMGTCECDVNSIRNDNGTGCLAQPLKTCAADSECVAAATCVEYVENDKRCRCNSGYVPEGGKCILVNAGDTVGEPCTRPNEECAFENSMCFGNMTCGCNSGWVFNGMACELPSGATCDSSSECGMNSYCARDAEGNNVCACLEGYAGSAAGVCMQVLGGAVGESCAAADLGCDFPNSVCTSELKCACTAQTVLQSNQCLVKAGKICQRTSDCVADATCADIGSNGNGMCKCPTNFLQTDEGLCSSSALVGYSSALLLFVVLLGIFNEKRC